MKIWVDNSAVEPNEESYLFRTEFLFGVRYLQKMGHEVNIDSSGFGKNQHVLIDQEQIKLALFSRDDADIVITTDEDYQLTAESLDITESTWSELVHRLIFPDRRADYKRKTNETDIELSMTLDGTGESDIQTGLNFFDHMLDQIAKHGLIDLQLQCKGDLEVDEHHTIEDVGIALGKTIKKALGSKKGIERYGFVLPMDEAQARVALDFSGRPYLKFEGSFSREYVGDFPTEMVEHFFYSLAINMDATLHIALEGSNEHHLIEAAFKGFARALRTAIQRNEHTINLLPSSKGLL